MESEPMSEAERESLRRSIKEQIKFLLDVAVARILGNRVRLTCTGARDANGWLIVWAKPLPGPRDWNIQTQVYGMRVGL